MRTRRILFALAALAVASCAKEAPVDVPQAREITITASLEGDPETRTSTVDGGTKVFWEPGDRIKVFYEGEGSCFESQSTGLSLVSTFKGTLNMSLGSSAVAGKLLWGLYPFRIDATSDGQSVTTVLLPDQMGRDGSFARNTHITLACGNSFGLRFYNVCGGIRFTLVKSGVRTVILEGLGGETLAGTVNLGFEDGAPAVRSVSDGASSISLSAPEGGTFKTGVWYYITVLPGSLPNGFRMTFRTDSEEGVYNHPGAVTVKRSVFGSLGNVDQNVIYATVDPVSFLPEIHDGSVVLACNANAERFLTEVTYPERDYTTSYILDYPPVAPGQSDVPPTYAIRWTADASAGALTARLVDGDWSQAFDLAAGASYFTVTNLRPNADYTYEIRSGGGKVLASGSFKTTGHVHQLNFKSRVRNCRDLGGWKTKDGRTVKYRKVYRGGRLESGTLTNEGKADILAEGIRAQLDLRGSGDVLSSSALGSGYDFCAPVIEHGYSSLLKNDGSKVKKCFDFIVKCVRENKPVYFHCSLGRDRTGTIAMVCLGILNVNEGDISKEYELTQFAPHSWATSDGEHTIMTRLADYDGAARYIWDNFTTGAETFAQGMEKYLISVGVSKSDINDFRNLMLD